MNWQENLIENNAQIADLLKDTKRIAVIGIKMESFQPAFYVPNYMKSAGFEIVPVPVYYPDATEILGEKVYRSLTEIPGEIDLVNIFRRSNDVAKHTKKFSPKNRKPSGCSRNDNDEVAETLAKAGIKVVQNLCLMVEHRSLGK